MKGQICSVWLAVGALSACTCHDSQREIPCQLRSNLTYFKDWVVGPSLSTSIPASVVKVYEYDNHIIATQIPNLSYQINNVELHFSEQLSDTTYSPYLKEDDLLGFLESDSAIRASAAMDTAYWVISLGPPLERLGPFLSEQDAASIIAEKD